MYIYIARLMFVEIRIPGWNLGNFVAWLDLTKYNLSEFERF